MPFIAPKAGIKVTPRGVYDTKRKTFSGRGKAPAGSRKVKAAPPRIVTTSPSGKITSSGFPSPRAAKAARKQASSSQRRVRRIERQAAQAREYHRRSQQRASERLPQPSAAALRKRDAPITTKTVISSKPLGNASDRKLNRAKSLPSYKPPKFQGAKTAGTPSLKELQVADKQGKIRLNKRGYVTTPAVRSVSSSLKKAQKVLRRSQPSLKGLAPEERAVVPLARKAHRKHPDIPTSLLMSLTRQESGFQADAVSSAGAQGLTQFIPSTAAAYGVKYGTGPREKQSQLTGAAKLLSDNNFASDPKGALTNYTGGYSDAEYNDPVLQGAADYKALDKPGSPKALRRLRSAQTKAQKLGLKTGGGSPTSSGGRKMWGGKKRGKLEGDVAGTTNEVQRLGRAIAGAVGEPLNVISGSRPGSITTSGNVSDHSSGNALDIEAYDRSEGASPKEEAKGNRIATAAAKVAGLDTGSDEFQSFITSGGVYEGVSPSGYRVQILWKTDIGGNHHNHVHVGIRPEEGAMPGAGTATLGGAPVMVSSSDVASYAQATGQSKAAVGKKLLRGKLTGYEILKKLDRLGAGVGAGPSEKPSEGSESKATVLKQLERTYGSSAV